MLGCVGEGLRAEEIGRARDRLGQRSRGDLEIDRDAQISRDVGKSFLQYQIEARLDLADELLRTREDTTVRKVAFELGYTDPYYFSRMYKKHRGHPFSTMLRRKRT